MRIKFLFLLLITNASLILGQKNFIGINSGVSWSKPTKSDAQERYYLPIEPTYGINYQYHFDNSWFLETGFGYQRLDFEGLDDWLFLPNSNPYFSSGSRYMFKYFTLPISVGKTFGNKLFYQPKIGLVLGKLKQLNHSYYNYYLDQEYYPRKYDLSIFLEQSIGYNLSDKFAALLNLKIQHGMIDYFYFNPFKDSRDYHRAIFLTLGLRYGF